MRQRCLAEATGTFCLVFAGTGAVVIDSVSGGAITAYCRNLRLQDADALGGLARWAILTFVILIALDEVQVGGDIVRQTFLIVLAGLVFALALAFGMGGREWAAEILERLWPRKKP